MFAPGCTLKIHQQQVNIVGIIFKNRFLPQRPARVLVAKIAFGYAPRSDNAVFGNPVNALFSICNKKSADSLYPL
jgi:hypothetical protein